MDLLCNYCFKKNTCNENDNLRTHFEINNIVSINLAKTNLLNNHTFNEEDNYKMWDDYKYCGLYNGFHIIYVPRYYFYTIFWNRD